jgi:hypothetical protein
MRLTSTGLGIGTSSPAFKLDVVGTARFTSGVVSDGTNGTMQFGSTDYGITGGLDNGGFRFNLPTGQSYQFRINNSDQMALNSTGLGIGTSSPGVKLDVNGSLRVGTATAAGVTAQFGNTGNVVTFIDSGATGNFGVVGANAMGFYTNGSEKMRLDSAGNVGIGTSSPSQKLHVVAAAGYNATFSENSSNKVRLQFYVDGNEAALVSGYDTTAKPMTFYTGGSLRATLDSSGNLGLGVTPSAWLWPNGSTGALQLQSGAGLSAYNATTYLSNNWYYNGGEKYIADGFATRYEQTTGKHVWYTAGNNTSGAGATVSWSTPMTLDASGNLGVGTTSPGAKLDVFGGSLFVGSHYVSTTNTDYKIQLRSVGPATNNNYTATISLAGGTTQPADTSLVFSTQNWNGSAYVVGEKMRLDNQGNLLVGLTSATGVALLQVSGPIQTTGYTVATLPAGTVGMRTYVTDALAPSFGVAVAGSGAVTIPVFYDGADWIVA